MRTAFPLIVFCLLLGCAEQADRTTADGHPGYETRGGGSKAGAGGAGPGYDGSGQGTGEQGLARDMGENPNSAGAHTTGARDAAQQQDEKNQR